MHYVVYVVAIQLIWNHSKIGVDMFFFVFLYYNLFKILGFLHFQMQHIQIKKKNYLKIDEYCMAEYKIECFVF